MPTALPAVSTPAGDPESGRKTNESVIQYR